MTSSLPDTWTQTLRSCDLFSEMSSEIIEYLGTAMAEVAFADGVYLVRQGEAANSLFVIIDGSVRVFIEGVEDVELHELGAGTLIGEVALVLGGERSASVIAHTQTRALELQRKDFEDLLAQYPEALKPFSAALQERMRRGRIAFYLRSLIGDLEPSAMREIEEQLTWVRLDSGETLFRQGEPPNGAYIIAVGRVRVVVTDRGRERAIDDIGPGQWIGEMALLTQQPRSATVYAIRDTELVCLSQKAFDALMDKHPRAMRQTSSLLVRRLQRATSNRQTRKAEPRTFAVIPAGDPESARAFCADLFTALRRHGSVRLIEADSVDAALGKSGIARAPLDGPAHLRVGPWLTDQENSYRFVVLLADPTDSNWSARAVRNADRILLVADGKGERAPTQVEMRMRRQFSMERMPKTSLVLLQRQGLTAFPGTARWLRARSGGCVPVDQVYHVRRGLQADVDRLARIITGRAVTLVLGGGGSRGYAHVGVIKVLEELGVPIDAVAGTSIGAAVAAAHALGFRASELLPILRPIFDHLLDPTLPLVSLASGRHADRGTRQVGGNLDIEDLAIPYFAMAANLTRGEEVVLRSGSLAYSTRASGSLPGVFPPVPWKEGELLVDGGLTNNVPIDTMDRLFPGTILAVDVMPEIDLVTGSDMPMHLSGWQAAWNLVNPRTRARGMPNILSILIRSATLASHSMLRAERAADLAELYLRPQVEQWNLLDFKAAESIAEQGYRSTLDTLRTWWEKREQALLGRA